MALGAMDIIRLQVGDPRYPASIQARLGPDTPPYIGALGNLELLRRCKLAVLCSVRCPGSLIVQSYDLVQRLRESPFALLGGFHSPMEKEWLMVLLRGPVPVIVCPARGIETMRLPAEYRKPLEGGRLLIISCFPGGPDRPTTAMAQERNGFVAALADLLFVAHASVGGKTEGLCREALALGKPLFTLDDVANANLLDLGAKPINLYNVSGWDWAYC